MDICVCADKNYLAYVYALFESISRFHKSDVVFHIITDESVGHDSLENIEKLIFENSIHVHKVNASEFCELRETAHFTRAMYYRFKIPELINKDWVLYLDCDMVVMGSLAQLFLSKITDKPLYAVRNPFFSRRDALSLKDNRYFNSGMLLINCKWWREQGVFEKLIDVLNRKDIDFIYPDQDALNIVYNEWWEEVSPSYNVQYSILRRQKSAIKESKIFEDAIKKPVIVHFSSPNKQWHSSCYNPYKFEYLKLQSSVQKYRFNFVKDQIAKVKGWLLYKYYNVVG